MPASRWSASGLLAIALLAIPIAPAQGSTSRDAAANVASDSALQVAARAFAGTDLTERSRAVDGLAEAARQTPARTDVWLAHGRYCVALGRKERAHDSFEHAARLSPEQASTWHELAAAWRSDWLLCTESASLEHALECHARAVELEPGRSEDWAASAMLMVLRGRPHEAIAVGLRAQAADPEGAGPWLALGTALYRSGYTALADSAFERARARCTPEALRRLDGDDPLAAADGDLAPSDEALRPAAWLLTDPDLTTAENEALLDYRTRVALALFLFEENGRCNWDLRTQLFVRYGPPSRVDYNAAGAQLGEGVDLAFRFPRRALSAYAPEPISFPYNMQFWIWDQLGIAVGMWDRSLHGRYEFPVDLELPREVRPDPGVLASRQDLMAVGGGLGVYRRIPPGMKPLRVTGRVTRFPQPQDTRLLVHAFAEGTTGDSMVASCAVVARDGRVLERVSRPVSISACEPDRRQVADFAVSVPAGEYRIDVSVSDTRDRRGVAQLASLVEPAGGLGVSDLVIMCQDARLFTGETVLRIEPAQGDEVGGTAALYYEIEGLDTSASGEAHFEYSYSVHALDKHGSVSKGRPAILSATREETTPDHHRRQIVNLPLAKVPPGRYVLDLAVRDLSNGSRVERRLLFSRLRMP